MATSKLLGECADVRLVCADGTHIMANKFTMLASCSVLRDMVSEYATLRTIPVPSLESPSATLAVELIHGLLRAQDLSLDDLERIFTAFEYLGCPMHKKKLLARLWHHLQRTTDPEVLFRHADRILYTEDYRRDYLSKLKSVCPTWTAFKRVFEHVTMSESLASFLMSRLCLYFPLHLVYNALLDAFPRSILTFDMAMRIFGTFRTGVYHHPDEAVSSMNKTLEMFPCDAGVDPLRTISDAFHMYDSSPETKMCATAITFVRSPKTSVLVKMHDPFKGTKSIKVKQYLRLLVNTVEGFLGGTVDVGVMDIENHRPDTLLARIMTFSATEYSPYDIIPHTYATTETWREFTHLNDHDSVDLAAPSVTSQDDERVLTEALTSPLLKYIRIDFFYDRTDIRTAPIF